MNIEMIWPVKITTAAVLCTISTNYDKQLSNISVETKQNTWNSKNE